MAPVVWTEFRVVKWLAPVAAFQPHALPDDGYRYLIHDLDSIFAQGLDDFSESLGLTIMKSRCAA